MNAPLLNIYSILFYFSCFSLHWVISPQLSSVLLNLYVFIYTTSLLIYIPTLVTLFLKYLALYFSNITFFNCTPFNTTTLNPVIFNKYFLLKSIVSTWIFYQQACIVNLYQYYVTPCSPFSKLWQVFMFLLTCNHILLLFLPKRFASLLVHSLIFIWRPDYFKTLMLIHSNRNLCLHYVYSSTSTPFNLQNLENFFKLEVFGVELYYLNGRFLLNILYKTGLSFLTTELILLEEPKNVEIKCFELTSVGCIADNVKDDWEFGCADYFYEQRSSIPEAGLGLDEYTTFLGIWRNVGWENKRVWFEFPVECVNLFNLYFKFLEKVLLDLEIISKVQIYYVSHKESKFVELILGDNNRFNLSKVTRSALESIDAELHHKLNPSVLYITFKDPNDFINFLNFKPDLRFKL